jgi:hypothetical protein
VSLTLDLLTVPSQFLGLLAQIAFERGDLEVALDLVHRAAHDAQEEYATDPAVLGELCMFLECEARVLDSLGRLDEAIARDAERLVLDPVGRAFVRRAKQHVARGSTPKLSSFSDRSCPP